VSPALAIGQGAIFAIGSLVFIAVFAAALSLAYARFEELGDDHRPQGER
jgi:hypothetical protein